MKSLASASRPDPAVGKSALARVIARCKATSLVSGSSFFLSASLTCSTGAAKVILFVPLPEVCHTRYVLPSLPVNVIALPGIRLESALTILAFCPPIST